MTHKFSSGVYYNGRPAWHGLGEVREGTPATYAQALSESKCDYKVGKYPIFNHNGEPIPGMANMIREDTGDSLYVAPASYTVQQNDTFEPIFQELMNRKQVEIDSMVSLDGGKQFVVSATISDAIIEIRGNTIVSHLCGITSHNGTLKWQLRENVTRIECANMLAQALGRTDMLSYAVKHTKISTELIETISDQIDLSRQDFLGGRDQFQSLVDCKVTHEQFKEYISEVYGIKNKIVPVKRGSKETRQMLVYDLPNWERLDTLFNSEARGFNDVEPTAWRAYNTVTEYVTHEIGRLKDKHKASMVRAQNNIRGVNDSLLANAYNKALELTRV